MTPNSIFTFLSFFLSYFHLCSVKDTARVGEALEASEASETWIQYRNTEGFWVSLRSVWIRNQLNVISSESGCVTARVLIPVGDKSFKILVRLGCSSSTRTFSTVLHRDEMVFYFNVFRTISVKANSGQIMMKNTVQWCFSLFHIIFLTVLGIEIFFKQKQTRCVPFIHKILAMI